MYARQEPVLALYGLDVARDIDSLYTVEEGRLTEGDVKQQGVAVEASMLNQPICLIGGISVKGHYGRLSNGWQSQGSGSLVRVTAP